MVQNEQLKWKVLAALYNHISEKDPALKAMADGDPETGAMVLEPGVSVVVDEPHKLRLHIGNFIGYGYDFGKKEPDTGRPAKDVYEHAVSATKKLGGSEHTETLVTEEIVDDMYGLYVTKV
ncbi:hypothetical protein ACFLZ7_03850 [Nanoarchaeota archaeon]